MEIIFNPPLRTTITIPVYHSSNTHPRLTFSATLSPDAYTQIKEQGAKIQVWSNLPSIDGKEEWREIAFLAPEKTMKTVTPKEGFLLAPPSETLSEKTSPDIILEAHFPLPPSETADQSYQYTYRILYPDGGIWWQGDGESSNGSINLLSEYLSLLENVSDAHPWVEADSESIDGGKVETVTFSSTEGEVASDEKAVGRLTDKVIWTGWAMSEDG